MKNKRKILNVSKLWILKYSCKLLLAIVSPLNFVKVPVVLMEAASEIKEDQHYKPTKICNSELKRLTNELIITMISNVY